MLTATLRSVRASRALSRYLVALLWRLEHWDDRESDQAVQRDRAWRAEVDQLPPEDREAMRRMISRLARALAVGASKPS